MFNKNVSVIKKELIVVDPGKYATKAIKLQRQIIESFTTESFRTKMADNSNELDAHGDSYSIVYEGNKYIIGQQAEESNYDVSKTNLLHKLATYTAIAALAESGSIIQLVVNCPVSIYKNKTLRDEYRNYIYNNGSFTITVNGEECSYKFQNVLVLPEDYGVVAKHPSYFKGKRVALIGLGGLNMNLMIVDDEVFEISTMFTVNHGGNELETMIVNELNSKFGLNIDHKDAPYILKNKGLKIEGVINSESVQIVEKCIKNFINIVIQETKKQGHSIDRLDVVFVGGTSESTESHIKKIITHAKVVNDAQWAAIEGSLEIGREKYEEADKV